MPEKDNKLLSRMESIRGDDHTLRNVLAVAALLIYVFLLYVFNLACLIATFNFTSAGIFTVIFGGFWKLGATKAIDLVLTLVFIAAELFLFRTFTGVKRIEKNDFEYADNGNYGTSKFLSSDIYKEFLELTKTSMETKGIILGIDPQTNKVVSIPMNNPLNRNIFICGSQGTSKSIAFSRTMVMQCALRGESVFLTDPKGELYRDLALFLKNMGYNVYQWNLVNRWSSDGWDMLQEVHGEEEFEYIDILVNTIIANTGAKEGGDFFDNIEGMLLKALCMYVLAVNDEKKKNFGEVYQMLFSNTAEQLDDKFQALSDEHDKAKAQAFGAYNLFAKSQSNKGNAILGLGSRLAMFSSDVVQRMVSTPDIQIDKLGDEKTAIFCIASDSNSTYAVLNSLLTSFTFIKVMAYADKRGGQCRVPVHFILDEFVNIGALPDFTKKLGTARSRDIGMTVIVQNMAQLENRYPKGQAEEIVGGCDFRILLGANDMKTAEYFSDLLGMTTIKVNSDRKSTSTGIFNVGNVTTVEGTTEGSGSRALLLPDEILAMDNDRLLLNVRGKRPIQLIKYKYFYDPDALLLRVLRPADVIPHWAVDERGIFLKTKQPVGETREQMEDRIMRDPEAFVVQDSERWGPQRTRLINEFLKIRSRYKGKETFPNGMRIDRFDDFVLGGKTEVEETENTPKHLRQNRFSLDKKRLISRIEKPQEEPIPEDYAERAGYTKQTLPEKEPPVSVQKPKQAAPPKSAPPVSEKPPMPQKTAPPPQKPKPAAHGSIGNGPPVKAAPVQKKKAPQSMVRPPQSNDKVPAKTSVPPPPVPKKPEQKPKPAEPAKKSALDDLFG